MLGMGGEDRGKPYEFKFFQGHIWTNVMADVEFDVDRTLRSRSPVRSPDWILALCWSDPYNLSTTVLKVIKVRTLPAWALGVYYMDWGGVPGARTIT